MKTSAGSFDRQEMAHCWKQVHHFQFWRQNCLVSGFLFVFFFVVAVLLWTHLFHLSGTALKWPYWLTGRKNTKWLTYPSGDNSTLLYLLSTKCNHRTDHIWLCRYPFHPRVTAVRSRLFCQKCRWQVTDKHAYTLRMWLCMKWHGAWLYGVHRTWDGCSFMRHQPCQRCKYTTSVDI